MTESVPSASSSPVKTSQALRAFRVVQDGRFVGYLGEGEGPFISQARSNLAYLVSPIARFTSTFMPAERMIAPAITESTDFASVLKRLESAGLVLQPIAYQDVFAPAEKTPVGDRRAVEQMKKTNDAF